MLRSIQGHDNANNNHLVTSLLLSSGFWSDYLSSMGTGVIRGLPNCDFIVSRRLMSTYNDWYSKFRTQPAAVSILDIFVEYGNEGSIVLLQACLDQVKFQSEDFQSKPDLVLSAIFRYFLGRPNFATVFCEALRSKVTSEGFLEVHHQLGDTDEPNDGNASVKKRTNVLLLGDRLGDLGMSDGLNYENQIAVGFFPRAWQSMWILLQRSGPCYNSKRGLILY